MVESIGLSLTFRQLQFLRLILRTQDLESALCRFTERYQQWKSHGGTRPC